MTDREANVRAAAKVALLIAIPVALAAVTSLLRDDFAGQSLRAIGRFTAAYPLAWFAGVVLAAGVVLRIILAEVLRRPGVFTFSDWRRMYCGTWSTRRNEFEWKRHLRLRESGHRDSLLRQSKLTKRQRAKIDGWERERKKREDQMLDYRMVDLPGYGRWSSRYERLDQINPDLEEFTISVHPDEFNGSLDKKFASEFQCWLDDSRDATQTLRKFEKGR